MPNTVKLLSSDARLSTLQGIETKKKKPKKRSSGEASEEGVKQSEEERLLKRAKMGYAAPPVAAEFKEWKQIKDFATMEEFVAYMLNKLVADWYATTKMDGAVRLREFEEAEMLARRKRVEAVLDAMPGLYALLQDSSLSHGVKTSI